MRILAKDLLAALGEAASYANERLLSASEPMRISSMKVSFSARQIDTDTLDLAKSGSTFEVLITNL